MLDALHDLTCIFALSTLVNVCNTVALEDVLGIVHPHVRPAAGLSRGNRDRRVFLDVVLYLSLVLFICLVDVLGS